MTQVGLRHGVVSLLVPTLLCLIGFFDRVRSRRQGGCCHSACTSIRHQKPRQSQADRSDPKSSDISTAKSDASDSSAARPSGPAKAQADQVDPLKRPLSPQEKKANEKRFKQEVSGAYKKLARRRRPLDHHRRRTLRLQTALQRRGARTSSSKPSGNAATPLPTPSKTNSRKSITVASPMRTNIRRRHSRLEN